MTELTLNADRRLTAERGLDTHFVLLSFRAPRLEKTGERPGLNLSLVLDRSGSMSGGKLTLAARAADLALARLTPKDRFSLVAYNHEVRVLSPSTPATPEALNEARQTLLRLRAEGNTALFDAYVRGAEQVATHLGDGDLGKVLLLTDGLANTGLTEPPAIVKHVAELRARGVLTSTFGVGADFNQLLLDGMAKSGGGNFYFVESANQLEDLLTSEVGEALETVAREVGVAIEHTPGIHVRLLDAFVHEHGSRGLMTRLGPLTSEQLVELLYEVEVPGRAVGEVSNVRFTVLDADGALHEPSGTVEFRHAIDAETEAEQADADVVRLAARRIRLHAGERAYAMNYEGRRSEVRGETSKPLEYLKRLAARDPAVAAMVAELEDDVARAGETMSEMSSKQWYYALTRMRYGRDAEGKARK